MKTKENAQRGFNGNKFSINRFSTFMAGSLIILFGGFCFFANAGTIDIEANAENAFQTIGRVLITDDGTNDGDVMFDFNGGNGLPGKAIIKGITSGTPNRTLGLNNADELIYTTVSSTDDGDWTIEANGVYRTGDAGIFYSTTHSYVGDFNVISDTVGKPELYIEQVAASDPNIHLKNSSSVIWSVGVSNSDSSFYVGIPGSVPNFSVYNGGGVRIYSGSLDMNLNNINNIDTATAIAFVMTSDESLKENVKIIQNPLKKIYALNGYTFDWKSNGENSIGLIAQEVEKVLPELVTVIDKDGHKGVQYANMVALLIEGIKELGTRIEGLYNKYLDQQMRIDGLEKRIQLLEAGE